MEKVMKVLQLVTNVAIVIVCGLLCWSFITHKTFDIREIGTRRVTADPLEGIVLPSLPGYKWENHAETLVLAIRKDCHFCEDSLPFYRRLGELEKSDHLHAHVLAVMPDDQESGTVALHSSGVVIEGVFGQPLDLIKVMGTPTVMLVDPHGRVVRAWDGQLTPTSEGDVISAASNALPVDSRGSRPWYKLW